MAEDEEQTYGMQTALDNARGLNDKVRLALGALRLQGPHLPQHLEHDAEALDAVRSKLQQLEDLLDGCCMLGPDANQADALCSVDQARGDLIATCRKCAKFITAPSQALVDEVLEFCQVGPEEDITPREFTACWSGAGTAGAADGRFTAVDLAPSYLSNTSSGVDAPASAKGGGASAPSGATPPADGGVLPLPQRRGIAAQRGEEYRLRGAARPSGGSGSSASSGRRDARGDEVAAGDINGPFEHRAGAHATMELSEQQQQQQQQQPAWQPPRPSPLKPSAARGAPAAARPRGAAAARASGTADAPLQHEQQQPSQQQGHQGAMGSPHRRSAKRDQAEFGRPAHHAGGHLTPDTPGTPLAPASPFGELRRGAAGGSGGGEGSPLRRRQPPPQEFVRYGGARDGAAPPAGGPGSAGDFRFSPGPVLRPGGATPLRAAVAQSFSQFGGKVSLQPYARGQADGSDDSHGHLDVRGPKVVHYADMPRMQRDTDAAADVSSSRDVWIAAAHMTSPPRMRVLQDAVTMSRDDLAGLERRGRRRGWMARAAKAFAWLTGAGALGAAVVITVRTVLDDYGIGGPQGDAPLEPMLPRFPGLLPPAAAKPSRAGRRERRRGKGDGGRGGGLVLQMPQMPFAPVFPAPSPLDSRA